MAQVPTDVTVGIQPGAIPGAQLAERRVAATPAAFGAAQGAALVNVGENMDNAAAIFTKQAIAAQQIQNETEATEKATQFSQTTSDLYAEFSKKQGKEAVDALPEFQQRLTAAREAALETSNPAVRRMLAGRIAQQSITIGAGAARYSFEQGRVASVNASEGAATQSINEGMLYRNDPANMDRALAQGLGEVQKIGEIQGWDAATLAAKQSQYRGRFYGNIINSMVDQDPMKAQALFDKVRNGLDAETQARIENMLSGPVRQRKAADIADSVTGGLPPSSETVRDRWFGRVEAKGTEAEREAARNPRSSASGVGQITDGLWKQYAPRLGLTDAQRNTREGANAVWAAVQQDARARIGRPLTPAEQAGAWFLGIEGVRAFITAGPNADALEVYKKAAGEGVATHAFAVNGELLKPGMTVGQVMSGLAKKIGDVPDQQQDRSNILRRGAELAGPDPQLRSAVLAQINQRFGLQDAGEAQARGTLDVRLRETGIALENGADVPIPEVEIRRLYPPEIADRKLDELHTQQIAGQIFKSVELATPEQIASMRADLENGIGPLTEQLRAMRGTRTAPGGGVAEEDKAGDLVARKGIADVFERRVRERNEAIQKDPAAYALRDPMVRQAAEHAATGQAGMADYVNATRIAQERLGVAPQDVRLLAKAQSQQIAQSLMNLNPERTSIRQSLEGLRQQYGEAWPAVFRDLVRDGKLPVEYQILAATPTAVGQHDIQAMLTAAQKAGGMNKLIQAAPEGAVRAVDDNLDAAVNGFMQSARALGLAGGDVLAANVREGVRNLAIYYTIGGAVDPATAVQRAADRIINDKYDMLGTMRVPKGMLPKVQAAQAQVMRELTPAQLADLPNADRAPGLTAEDHRDIMWRAAKRGQWATNETDNGVVLMIELQNGARIPARLQNGKRVELFFDNLPAPRVDGVTPTPTLGFTGEPGERTPAVLPPAETE
jgi:hypothetical protein